MSHPNIEDLDRMVLRISNKLGDDRLFIEARKDHTNTGESAAVDHRKDDAGWFDQAWFAEFKSQSADKTSTAYSLRNICSGTYLQAVEEPLPDASREIKLAPKAKNTRTGKWQTWLFTDDGGFARMKNHQTGQVLELVESQDGTPARVILRKDDPENKTTQAWKYERVSRAAQDITAAMKANGHIENGLFEYQNTDATYITLPPKVRDEIWKSTGLGSDSLVWRNQIFDCDDFAFTAKTAVSRWTAMNLKAEGFTALFGITFGERNVDGKLERHAYNWYLDWEDLTKIVFFDPMTNLESDDGWNFRGFNGIF